MRALLLGDYEKWTDHPFKGPDGVIKECLEAYFTVDARDDYRRLTPEDFDRADMLALYTDCWEETLPPETEAAVMRFMSPGRGILAIHSGLFYLQANPAFLPITRARFTHHPEHAIIRYHALPSAITNGADDFEIDEEPYRFEFYPSDIHIAAQYFHEGQNWPAAWTNEINGGRFCYLSMGHDMRTFDRPEFKRLMTNSAEWIARER